MKAWMLLLLPLAASAQVDYDYTSGPITAVQNAAYNEPPGNAFGASPVLGTDMSGTITLAQALPQNGTTTVTPLAMSFAISINGGASYQFSGTSSSLTATTANGAITAFDFDSSKTVGLTGAHVQASNAGASFIYGTPAGFIGADAGGGIINHMISGPSGNPVRIHGVPEINPAGIVAALTLLAGLLASAARSLNRRYD